MSKWLGNLITEAHSVGSVMISMHQLCQHWSGSPLPNTWLGLWMCSLFMNELYAAEHGQIYWLTSMIGSCVRCPSLLILAGVEVNLAGDANTVSSSTASSKGLVASLQVWRCLSDGSSPSFCTERIEVRRFTDANWQKKRVCLKKHAPEKVRQSWLWW